MTHTYYAKQGTRYMATTKESMDLHERLPVGTYTVKQDPMSGTYFLEAVEGFKVSGKVYGDTRRTAARIISTFHDRENSTGAMFSGEKGSGKTLLAKLISVDAQKLGIPTIIINQPHAGEGFNSFMQMIEQPTVVIFDEFEKVYDSKEQEQMLTLLDGVYPSKKLFIITCNDKWRVNEHMRNRPGRIFYRLEFKGLEDDFIREYCEDNLTNKSHIEAVTRVAVLFSEFNFDILKALVEEMNRYDESPQEAIKLLNAKPENGENATYDLSLKLDGKTIPAESFEDVWRGNPLSGNVNVYVKTGKLDEDEDPIWEYAHFTISDLKSIDSKTGSIQFENKQGYEASLSKAKVIGYDLNML